MTFSIFAHILLLFSSKPNVIVKNYTQFNNVGINT